MHRRPAVGDFCLAVVRNLQRDSLCEGRKKTPRKASAAFDIPASPDHHDRTMGGVLGARPVAFDADRMMPSLFRLGTAVAYRGCRRIAPHSAPIVSKRQDSMRKRFTSENSI